MRSKKPLYTYLKELIFPSVCWHCQNPILTKNHLFCESCVPFFDLIDFRKRCPYCCCEQENARPCSKCVQNKRWQIKLCAATECIGPVSTLVSEMKYGKTPFLAKTAAAFITLQFCRLEWPKPDWIVAVPKRLWFKRTHHATLIAESVSEFLQVPVLKKKEKLLDQTLLVIDDLIETGITMHAFAATIFENFPAKIYGLAFASITASIGT